MAAEMTNNSAPTTVCFCEQRMQLEPDLYLNLGNFFTVTEDVRYQLCQTTIQRIWLNNVLVYVRVCAMMFIDELYRTVVHTWARVERH